MVKTIETLHCMVSGCCQGACPCSRPDRPLGFSSGKAGQKWAMQQAEYAMLLAAFPLYPSLLLHLLSQKINFFIGGKPASIGFPQIGNKLQLHFCGSGVLLLHLYILPVCTFNILAATSTIFLNHYKFIKKLSIWVKWSADRIMAVLTHWHPEIPLLSSKAIGTGG